MNKNIINETKNIINETKKKIYVRIKKLFQNKKIISKYKKIDTDVLIVDKKIMMNKKKLKEVTNYPFFFKCVKNMKSFEICYMDPYIITYNYRNILFNILDKHCIPEISNVILDFTCGYDQTKQKDTLNYTFKNGRKKWNTYPDSCKTFYNLRKEPSALSMKKCTCREPSVYKYPSKKIKAKSYLKCIDKPYLLKDYENFSHERSINEFWYDIYPTLNKYYASQDWMYDYDRRIIKFSLTNGWYSKVMHISDDGNSLKQSVIKMRERILSRYPKHIFKKIKWGCINKKKEFNNFVEKMSNSLVSLNYFHWLLSTPQVYFINTLGELVFDISSNSNVPSFYSCFFLIEGTDDKYIGKISAIDMGCLNENYFPCKILNKMIIKKFI